MSSRPRAFKFCGCRGKWLMMHLEVDDRAACQSSVLPIKLIMDEQG